ncbi:hypothetical protein HTG_00495 [Natrinema mahii]|nr:hypothetical protein HTG_00495 [Natrinema mahii]
MSLTERVREYGAAVFAGTIVVGVCTVVFGAVFGATAIALGAATFGVAAALVGAVVGAVRGPHETETGPATTARESTADRGRTGTVTADSSDDETPLETLRERYARGELSDDAFERKLATLLETDVPEDARRHTRCVGEEATEREIESSRS